jgi:hypothetical protein
MQILALFQTNMPWGVMIVSALLGLVAAWLVIYFYRRFKTTETDAEEDDWGPRGLRLDSERRPPSVTPEAEPHEVGVIDGTVPERITAPLVSASADTRAQETIEGLSPRLQPTPAVTELNPTEAVKQSLAEEISTRTEEPHEGQTLPMTTPLSDEIRGKPDTTPEGQAAVDQAEPEYPPLEPYEPPRIEPIVPRKPAPSNRPVAAPSAPVSAARATPTIPIPSLQQNPLPRMSAAERTPKPEARLVQTPEPIPASTQRETPGHLDGPSARGGDGPGATPQHSSDLGDMADIGTLANYGKSGDDGGGRGGTIALAGIVLVVVAAVLAFIFVPSLRSAITKGKGAEADVPKAQIFITRAEPSNANSNAGAKNDSNLNQQKMKGTVQNTTTNESLSGLVVGLSLIPRSKQGAPTNIDAPVTPDQIGAGEAGDFDFDVDATKFEKYKVVSLKTKNGKDVPFTFPQSSTTSTNQ